MFYIGILIGFASLAACQISSQTAVPSSFTSSSSSYTYSDPGETLAAPPPSTHTYLTPTSAFTSPTFTTPTPIPQCTNIPQTICTGGATQGVCYDVSGAIYGLLCATQLSGDIITNDGRLAKRIVTGDFANCVDFCDGFGTDCVGVGYRAGECLAYDNVTGTFADPKGGIAAFRQ